MDECGAVINAAHYLQLIGLVVGFAGALLVTVTMQQGETISEGGPKGERFYIVMAYPGWWKFGLALLCAGFVVQFIGEALPR